MCITDTEGDAGIFTLVNVTLQRLHGKCWFNFACLVLVLAAFDIRYSSFKYYSYTESMFGLPYADI